MMDKAQEPSNSECYKPLSGPFRIYFSFPCQFSSHQLFHTRLPSRAGTVDKLVADVPSGLSLNPPHEIKKKYIYKMKNKK
jgi:hypothetical protein